jgi:hypothetical protein
MHKSPLNYPGVVLRAGMLQASTEAGEDGGRRGSVARTASECDGSGGRCAPGDQAESGAWTCMGRPVWNIFFKKIGDTAGFTPTLKRTDTNLISAD